MRLAIASTAAAGAATPRYWAIAGVTRLGSNRHELVRRGTSNPPRSVKSSTLGSGLAASLLVSLSLRDDGANSCLSCLPCAPAAAAKFGGLRLALTLFGAIARNFSTHDPLVKFSSDPSSSEHPPYPSAACSPPPPNPPAAGDHRTASGPGRHVMAILYCPSSLLAF